MPILFNCPHCGHQTNVADQFAGQTGPCSKCGQVVTIPSAPMGGPPMPPAPGPAGVATGISTVAIVVICILGAVVCCGGVITIPALLLPAIQAARSAAQRTQSANNLKQIGLAMQNHADANKSFPTAYTVDAEGQPLHSWRVTILPYVEEADLYRQIRLDEPWDSPHNRQFHSRMPMVYRSPAEPENTTTTDYLAITGPGLIFDGTNATNFGQITDGTSNTILLVEANGRKVNWMQPVDIDVQTIGQSPKNTSGGDGISGKYPGGANVLFADGSVQFLTPQSLMNLNALLTKSGGEPVNR